MSANLGTIYYTVEARTAALLSAEKEVTKSMGSMTREMQGAERQAASLSTGMTKLASAIKVVIAASALRQMADMVQSYQEMSERVQMATSSQAEFEMVQRRLLDTANGTYRSLAEAQELYIRTADSLRSMGYSTEQAMDITDAMSYAFVTNATSADRAAAATSAFSKSMNTGKVAADQWETITSAIPSVINAIADASGKSAAEVRALGAAGKLSARDLSEGLRKSLDEVSEAAGKMANNLTDAGVRSATALTAVLVAMEDQTGGLQRLTDSIIAAADAMLEFGLDAEKMQEFLELATIAAASLAAVVAGRMITAIGAFAAARVEMAGGAIVARRLALANLELAKAEAAVAETTLATARAEAARLVGLPGHAAAVRALTAAEAQHAVASKAVTAAQATVATTAGIATVAVNGLRTAMSFLGGPVGVAMLAAIAVYAYTTRTKEAKNPTTDLRSEVDLLNRSFKDFTVNQANAALLDYNAALVDAQLRTNDARDAVDHYQTLINQHPNDSRVGQWTEALIRARGEVDSTRSEVERLISQIERLEKIAGGAGDISGDDDGPPRGGNDDLSEFQKLEKSLKDQIELTKRAGLARKELSALQKLGANATEKEKARITELVGELYRLEEAQEASQKAKDGIKANADTIAELEEQMRQAEMTAGELAARQAELALNEYATPEQIRRVRELGEAMRENAELERMEKMRDEAIAADPRTAAANQYQQQLEAYRAYKEAELLTDQQYNELKNAAATQYEQQRLAAQEEIFRAQSRGNEFLMNSIDALGQASTDVLSGILSGTMNGKEAMQAFGQAIFREAIGAVVQMGVQYVKSLIMGQAAQTAAAATAVATGGAVAAAWAPAAAAVSLATLGANSGPAIAGITATGAAAQAMTLAGGRQYGGPVAAGKMYRINENGAPEVFNAANGRQYMMPNTRGEVVSNKDATESGKGSPVEVRVIVNEAPPGTSVEQRTAADGVQEFVVDLRQGGPRAKALEAYYGMRRVGR